MVNPLMLVAIGAGGAVGALMRYGLGQWAKSLRPDGAFPLGTLTANLIGCFALGFCFVWLTQADRGSPEVRAAVQVGLIGALTTFSTYSVEAVNLMQQNRVTLAIGYTVGSVVLGPGMAWGGMMVGRAIGG